MKYRLSSCLAMLLLLLVSVAAAPTTAPASDAEQIAIRPRAAALRTAGARPSDDGGIGFWRVMGALVLVLAAIGVLQWVGRRMFSLPGSAGSGGPIRVLSRTTIAPRQQLMLVQVGRRVVLTANCGTQVNSLCEITDPEEIAMLVAQERENKLAATARPFMAFFGKAGGAYDEPANSADSPAVEEEESADALSTTREEIGGLLEKVRSLSKMTRKR